MDGSVVFRKAARRSCATAFAAGAASVVCATLAGAAPADLDHWRPLRPSGPQPPPLQWAATAFDPAGHRLLMFAGTDQVDDHRDLWALDLTAGSEAWAKLRPAGNGPTLRQHAAAAFVASHRRLVVFGGYSQLLDDTLDDTWITDFAAGGDGRWVKIAGRKPDKRRAATLVHQRFDGPSGATDRVILFGGFNGSQRFNDVWAFDATPGAEAWTELAPAGTKPSTRDGHVAVYDAPRNRMIVYGGTNRDRQAYTLGDAWSLDLTPGAERWSRLDPGGTRAPAYTWASGVVDPCAGAERLLVFGGYSITADRSSNDTWALALAPAGSEAWTDLDTTGARPVPRDAHAAAYDPVGRRMVIYGGWDGPGQLQRDAWTLDLLPCGGEPVDTPTPPATIEPTAPATSPATEEATPSPVPTTPQPTDTSTPSTTATPDAIGTVIAATLTALAPTAVQSATPDVLATAVAGTLTASAPRPSATPAPPGTPDPVQTAIAATLTALAPPPGGRLFMPIAVRP